MWHSVLFFWVCFVNPQSHHSALQVKVFLSGWWERGMQCSWWRAGQWMGVLLATCQNSTAWEGWYFKSSAFLVEVQEAEQ